MSHTLYKIFNSISGPSPWNASRSSELWQLKIPPNIAKYALVGKITPSWKLLERCQWLHQFSDSFCHSWPLLTSLQLLTLLTSLFVYLSILLFVELTLLWFFFFSPSRFLGRLLLHGYTSNTAITWCLVHDPLAFFFPFVLLESVTCE